MVSRDVRLTASFTPQSYLRRRTGEWAACWFYAWHFWAMFIGDTELRAYLIDVRQGCTGCPNNPDMTL